MLYNVSNATDFKISIFFLIISLNNNTRIKCEIENIGN